MKERYEFLLALKLLQYEIDELTAYAKACRECFSLLKKKLDVLCRFIVSDANFRRWHHWGHHAEIAQQCEKVRETSVKALCDMEKYHSLCTSTNGDNGSNYLAALSRSVQHELDTSGIDRTSKVLFIGSGAYPTSALAIAKAKQAEVLGLDIDREAVELAARVTKAFHLDAMVRFTSSRVTELSYVSEATHIIVASLVKEKWDIVDAVKTRMRPDATIIVRYGNGIKSLFNYPLEHAASSEWAATWITHRKNLYDTVILKRALSGTATSSHTPRQRM